jgi:5'-3' exonuclease
MSEVVLIDLSSVLYPIWHMSQNEPDTNHTSTATVAKVRALASGQPYVAVCCDSGRSFRADIDPSYKATRGERDATLIHQLQLAQEQLLEDGFPVWSQPGMEADDLIATAARLATEAGMGALVVSADKDLLQLVSPTVRVKSTATGTEYDEAGVEAKLGVKPSQVRDYLTLVGDTADNVKGADGIGPKKASVLLWTYGDLEGVYAEAAKAPNALKPSEAASLAAFAPRMETVRALISLRYDADVPFSEVLKDRVPKDAATFAAEEEMETVEAEPIAEPGPLVGNPGEPKPQAGILAVREPEVLAPAPAEWERQLDPRSMKEARVLAEDLFKSRMFSAYGTPHGVLSTVLVGRELGLPAMAALRSIHNIDGRHTLSAALMAALVLKSGMAEYFEPISFSEKEATFETKRKGARNPVRVTHTIEMARAAWPKTEDKWLLSGWGKNPTDMLVARAQSRLARLVYPDLLAGLYTPEELADMREMAVAA